MRFFLIVSALYLLGSGILSSVLIQYSKAYQKKKEIYAEQLNYRERFLDPDEWLSNEEGNNKLAFAEKMAAQAAQYQSQSLGWSIALLILGFLYGIITYLFFRKEKLYIFLVLGFIMLALSCLPAGLMSPMLEIAAFERNLDLGNIPISARVLGVKVDVQVSQRFEGDMYFYYQSKSVVELISLLFQQGNWVVGISILLFSILFPISKITSTFILAFWPKMRQQKWMYFFVEKSGKWSMADVFVVAVFLSFLAFSNMQVGIDTESNVLAGLYFFLAYCILSLLSSLWVSQLDIEKANGM